MTIICWYSFFGYWCSELISVRSSWYFKSIGDHYHHLEYCYWWTCPRKRCKVILWNWNTNVHCWQQTTVSITGSQSSVILQQIMKAVAVIVATTYCNGDILPVPLKQSISICHWYLSFDPSIATMSWQKYCATFFFLVLFGSDISVLLLFD